MPRYPYRCTACGAEFEVSRAMRDAGTETSCPVDGAAAERIFEAPRMNLNRPQPTTPSPPSRGFTHHGHSHGPGAGHHSH